MQEGGNMSQQQRHPEATALSFWSAGQQQIGFAADSSHCSWKGKKKGKLKS